MRLKLLALVLALGLWVIVMGNLEGIYVFNKELSVRLFNVPAEMVVTNKEALPAVKLFLRGPKDKFKDLRAEDFNVYVDLNGLGEGRHQVPVQVTLEKQREARVARVEPSQLDLVLEQKITKTLPVVVVVEGKVSPDFVPKTPEAAITSAKVTGGKSLVNQAAEAVTLLKFAGDEETDVEKSLSLVARDDRGNILTGLEIVPSTVKVRAVLERVSHSRTVGVRVQLGQGGLAEGYWLKSMEVEPATVTIKGDPARLKRLDFVSTAEVDIAGLSRDYVTRVDLKLPPDIELAANSASRVTVKVKVATTATKRALFADILVENLSGVKLEKIEPASVRVELEGSLEAVSSLKASDVFFRLDLSGYTEGSEEIALDKKQLTLPQAVKLVGFSAEKVKVTLVKVQAEKTVDDQPAGKPEPTSSSEPKTS